MELEFISNTGAYITHDGLTLGLDPWLTPGAFEGSWYHYPPLRKTRSSVVDCDAIYISHIHPDHCDFNTIRQARADCLFIVPSYFNDLIKRKLAVFGFTNVISLSDNEEAVVLGSIKVKLFGQFVKSLGSKSAQFGSLIDTAILIEWDGRTILNCNDNYLDVDSAHEILKQHPTIDCALMPHSASGPYPASFMNMTLDERRSEADRLQHEYVDLFVQTTAVLSPRLVSPTAAEYVIVGRNWDRNDHIGLATPEMAVDAWNHYKDKHGHQTEIKQLDCGTILNIDTGKVSGLMPRSFSLEEKMKFAENLKSVSFRYEWEDTCPSVEEFERLMQEARKELWKMQTRLDWFRDYNMVLNIDERIGYKFNFDNEGIEKMNLSNIDDLDNYVMAYVSTQLIYSIITGRVHWNNAEGGLHIDFFRKPNIFIPEVYTLMSFFKA